MTPTKNNTENHDCATNKCEGRELNGLNLICNICTRICFLTCLLKKKEVFELLESVGLIKYDETKNKTYPILNDNTIKKFHTIIGTDTLFEFTCEQCKEKGTTKDKIDKLQNKLKKMELTNMDLQGQLDSEMTVNEKLKQTIEDNKILIEQLTDEANKQNNNSGAEKNDATKIPNTMIENEMNKLVNKLNEIIINECNNLKEKILTQNYTVQKATKSVIINAPETNEQRNRNGKSTKKTQSSITDYLTQTKRKEQHEIKNCLRPPQQIKKPTMTKNKDREIYEMYVSQFEYGTKEEMIIQHILEKTEIVNKDSFNVEEIESKSSEEPNYVAFKITTLKKELYDEILGIWAPDFYAREYKSKQTNETNNHNVYSKHKINPFKRPQHEQHNLNQTPWKKKYDTNIDSYTKTHRNTNERERQTQKYRHETPRYRNAKYERTPQHRNERENQRYKHDNYNYERTRYRNEMETPQHNRKRFERETPLYRKKQYEKWATPTTQKEYPQYIYTQPQINNQINPYANHQMAIIQGAPQMPFLGVQNQQQPVYVNAQLQQHNQQQQQQQQTQQIINA